MFSKTKIIFKTGSCGIILFFFLGVVQVTAQQKINPNATEQLPIQVINGSNLISLSKIARQEPPGLAKEGDGRGIGLAGMVISKAVKGVQQMIANRQKKYTTSYMYAFKDEKFYDNISDAGSFDPTGIRFSGFSVARIFKDIATGETDTAFVAKFSIDTSQDRIVEMLNNSIFRLRLESFALKSAKVKFPDNDPVLNMDFEISFLSSFITENSVMNTDVTVGKFVYTIRNAPLDPKAKGYDEYYQKLKNSPCSGHSFLIPRSYGYYNKGNSLDHCYGQGLFTVKVLVKESSKNNFVDKIISIGSDDAITIGNKVLTNKFGSAF